MFGMVLYGDATQNLHSEVSLYRKNKQTVNYVSRSFFLYLQKCPSVLTNLDWQTDYISLCSLSSFAINKLLYYLSL